MLQELGPRQARLIELLRQGPHSLEALMQRLGADSEQKRKLWADSLRGLEAAGAVQADFGLLRLTVHQMNDAA
jgi:hypothetical protein